MPSLRILLAFAGVALLSASADAFVPAGPTADASRWQSTAAGSTGSAGDPITLTWSLIPDGTLVGRPENLNSRESSDLIATFDARFGAGPGGVDLTQRPWFSYFDDAFARWTELSGVTYVYEPNDNTAVHGGLGGQPGVRGDVRIGGIGMDGVGGTLAYNYFATDGGDMAIDTDDLSGLLGDASDDYRNLRNTIMHEAGHGLGLDHVNSGNANFLMEPALSFSFDGPQHDDLRGIHWMYGDALEKGGRNESAATATLLGSLTPSNALVIGAGGSGASVGATETDFVSISNQNDQDFFAFTISEPIALNLTLTPRGANYTQNGSTFVTTETSDLSLALFDSDQQTLLAESADGVAGVVESVAEFPLLEAGTYYARVRGPVTAAQQVTQFYELGVSATSLLPALPGDFNEDGVVDAADYTVWRDQQNQPLAPYSGADHNGSGSVDAGDYALWAANYGATLGGVLSVPEPTTAVLLLPLGLARRRRQSD